MMLALLIFLPTSTGARIITPNPARSDGTRSLSADWRAPIRAALTARSAIAP
ncbi:MAG TPA: hypothetical protein VEL31_22910 [Ktedonobacteraceae bacterium]|nr:hypothetical protein [Ktedonobacteraceae bacterium]